MLTLTQAAARLGAPISTVRWWAANGRIPGAVKAGPRAWLIPDPPVVTGGLKPRGRPRKERSND